MKNVHINHKLLLNFKNIVQGLNKTVMCPSSLLLAINPSITFELKGFWIDIWFQIINFQTYKDMLVENFRHARKKKGDPNAIYKFWQD